MLMWWSRQWNRSFFFTLAVCRTRSSACGHAIPALRSGTCFLLAHVPLGPALGSTGSAAVRNTGFVRRLPSYFGEVRLLGPVHHRLRLLAFPDAGRGMLPDPNPRSPGSRTKSRAQHARVSDHAEPSGRSPISLPLMSPSTSKTVSAFGHNHFRGSMAGPMRTSDTLRRRPYGRLRMPRGHCGSLLPSVQWTCTTYSSPVLPAHL